MSSIIVLGSLHYDIIVRGPDRPRKGETVAGSVWAPKCGGKGGNQAVAAARAGAKVTMIGAVGDDAFGAELLANLKKHGVDHRWVATVPGVKSGMSVAIFDADGDYGAVIVSGANLTLSDASLETASELFARGGWLVLQNEIADEINALGAEKMHAAGGRVLLNAAPVRPLSAHLLAHVDVLVVNALEAEGLTGSGVVESLAGANAAAGSLLEMCNSVVVTAGGHGVAYADRSGRRLSVPGIPVRVESTHGAGDEFIGCLTAGLAGGQAVETALQAANAAAAWLVGTPEQER